MFYLRGIHSSWHSLVLFLLRYGYARLGRVVQSRRNIWFRGFSMRVCVWQEIKVCTASVVLMMLLAYANEFGVNLGFGHVVFKLF